MVAFPIDYDAMAAHASPELEIRRVTDAAGIDLHCQVVTAGFGSDPAVARGTACPHLLDAARVRRLRWLRRGETRRLGPRLADRPDVGVYSIATVESARRRGYGAAMTAHVVVDGMGAGCDVAALQASAIGRPIYERLGFRTVVRYAARTSILCATRDGAGPGPVSVVPA